MTMTVLNVCQSDNTMADTDGNDTSNVKVIVRVRPPNEMELNGHRKNVVEIMNENILVFDPKEESSPFPSAQRRRRYRDLRKRRQKDLKFAFDHVFGEMSNNNEVFEHTTKTVLDGLLGGYNCSVFAYGATGAGKTHTMLGSESHPGVIYHTMIYLYKHIEEMSAEKTCDVAVSYLEVYNEQIRDLLMPRGTLPIREDASTGVIVPGLSLHKPNSAEELLHMLQFGNKNRTQHPTDANAESSRSHAVFQVFVRQRERTANISAQVRVAKMCLVDLAGSERATVTKNRGARFREGANINRSLLALGNVINSLADQKYKGHIPYRDSKLTRLLKDSLGGNCRTIMIAAVSPSELSYEDTYNTLKYADRAKNIRLDMKRNVLNVDFHVSRYGKIVEELRREITELKTRLQHCERPAISKSLTLPPDLQLVHENLQTVYNERRTLRNQQLQQETSERDIQWRLHRMHKCLRRASQLTPSQPEMVQKLQAVIRGLQNKLTSQQRHRQALSQQLQDNTQRLHHLQSQAVAGDNKASVVSRVMEISLQKLALEVELNDSTHYIGHLRRLARAQEQEAVANETLISALLHLVQRQQTELCSRGPVAPDIAFAYQNVCELVGQRGVSWADGEEERDQDPFHINNIIDIPLTTSNGVTVDRMPWLTRASSSKADTGTVNKLNPVMSCPGRVVNGQVVFSTSNAAGSSTPPRSMHTPASHSLRLLPSLGANAQSLSTSGENGNKVPEAKQTTTVADEDGSSCGHGDGGGDNATTGNSHLAATTCAGHTPHAKKLGHHSESKPSGELCYNPASTITPGPSAGQTVQNSVTEVKQCVRESRVFPSSTPRLNETFSIEDSVRTVDGQTTEDANSTVILSGPSLQHVPVVSSSAMSRSNCVSVASNRNSVNNLHPDLGSKNTHYPHQGTTSAVSSSSNSVVPQLYDCGIETRSNAINTDTCTAAERNADEITRIRPEIPHVGDENRGLHQKPHSAAKRSINFEDAESISSPLRVEGKSYADALKTPSPPRQPLQTLNGNSPQLRSTNLPNGLQQTPKSSGRNSVYLAGPQALDNMRRLKQIGMPSLVANLVTGSRNVSRAKPGPGINVSRPSYMQPTKATAQRVRRQHVSSDDNLHPKRVQPRPLVHSRSKSTSHLNRLGWKV